MNDSARHASEASAPVRMAFDLRLRADTSLGCGRVDPSAAPQPVRENVQVNPGADACGRVGRVSGPPRRVQVVRGQRLRDVVFVGAPSSWRNPFDWREMPGGRAAAVERYRRLFYDYPVLVERARRYLAGRDLACWCRIGEPCHADVLLVIANDIEEGNT